MCPSAADQRADVGTLHDFAYPLEGGAPGEELVVSTTRLETMLGDVAVAVCNCQPAGDWDWVVAQPKPTP
jgi:valyl-tRNA synthetase